MTHWTGVRVDSGDPIEGGEIAIDWWKRRNQDPTKKLAIFSDGLDVESIERIHRHFHGRVRIGYGWGTLLTNDFRGLGAGRRPRPVLHRLQGDLGQRPAGGEALGQPDQGHGAAGGGRALPARLPGRRAGQCTAGSVGAPTGLARRIMQLQQETGRTEVPYMHCLVRQNAPEEMTCSN